LVKKETRQLAARPLETSRSAGINHDPRRNNPRLICLHRAVAQHAVAQHAVVQHVSLAIAVAVAGGQVDFAGVAIGAETMRGVAGGIVVGYTTGVGVGNMATKPPMALLRIRR
jgi:hypothetical protein